MLPREGKRTDHPRRPRHADGQHDAPLLDAGAACRARSPSPTARRSASSCSAKTSSRSATATAASASSTNSVRIAASRCSFGRNEECGLRCVYHGWKFDVEGNCLDQLNEPPENQFKQHIHLTAYPTVELGGIVWAYLGPADKMPPAPKFAWTQVPEERRHVSKVIEECNWLQALGGRHRHLARADPAPPPDRQLDPRRDQAVLPFVRGKAPNLVVDVTDYGYLYAGIRPLGDDDVHIRSYHFVMPFHQIRPSTLGKRAAAGRRPHLGPDG